VTHPKNLIFLSENWKLLITPIQIYKKTGFAEKDAQIITYFAFLFLFQFLAQPSKIYLKIMVYLKVFN